MDLPKHGYQLVLSKVQICLELSPPQQRGNKEYRICVPRRVIKCVRFWPTGLCNGEVVLGLW